MGYTNDSDEPSDFHHETEVPMGKNAPGGALMAAQTWLHMNGLHWLSTELDVTGVDTVEIRCKNAAPPPDGPMYAKATGEHVLTMVWSPPGSLVEGGEDDGWAVDWYDGPVDRLELPVQRALMVVDVGSNEARYVALELEPGWE